jgi:hypothetical protein
MRINDPEIVASLRRERTAQGLPALDINDPTALQVLDDVLRCERSDEHEQSA